MNSGVRNAKSWPSLSSSRSSGCRSMPPTVYELTCVLMPFASRTDTGSPFSRRSVPAGSAGIWCSGAFSSARAYRPSDQGLPLCATYIAGCCSVVFPLPVESVHAALLPAMRKLSLTLLPNVVVPVIVHAAGRPLPSRRIVSAIVGPRPLFLKSKSIFVVSPDVFAFKWPTFLPPKMTVKVSVSAFAIVQTRRELMNRMAAWSFMFVCCRRMRKLQPTTEPDRSSRGIHCARSLYTGCAACDPAIRQDAGPARSPDRFDRVRY